MTPPQKKRRRRGRGGGGGGGGEPQLQLTSQPTGRKAYEETRKWLIERHGPVCAYCGRRYDPDMITLDHVAPRSKGAVEGEKRRSRRVSNQYDRRDNLVLACKSCNAAKADMPLLAFLFRNRLRAVHFVRYADHLSPMLLDLVRPIAVGMGAEIVDADSPYRDVNWKEPSREVLEAQVEQAMAAMDEVMEAEEASSLPWDDEDDEDVSPYAD